MWGGYSAAANYTFFAQEWIVRVMYSVSRIEDLGYWGPRSIAQAISSRLLPWSLVVCSYSRIRCRSCRSERRAHNAKPRGKSSGRDSGSSNVRASKVEEDPKFPSSSPRSIASIRSYYKFFSPCPLSSIITSTGIDLNLYNTNPSINAHRCETSNA